LHRVKEIARRLIVAKAMPNVRQIATDAPDDAFAGPRNNVSDGVNDGNATRIVWFKRRNQDW
jgi:hypothetical protein